MRIFISVLLLTLFSLVPNPASAQADRYQHCMDMVTANPSAAYEESLSWRADGGGAPAKHCLALSLLAMGDIERAAQRLEDLGYAPELNDPHLRAEIFSQSAEAFLQLGQPNKSLSAIDQALALEPQNIGFLIDRARSLVALDKPEQGLNELDQVLARQPDQLLALRLRATGLIYLGRLQRAKKDVDRAMKLAPTDVDVLLLRGAYQEAIRLADQP